MIYESVYTRYKVHLLSFYTTGLHNEMLVKVPFCYFRKITIFMVECRGWVLESYSRRKEAALWSGGTAVDIPVSLARQQLGDLAVAGVSMVFYYPLGSARAPHFTNVAGSIDVLGSFNSPLQKPLVLGRTQTIFWCYLSGNNLAWEFGFLMFP